MRLWQVRHGMRKRHLVARRALRPGAHEGGDDGAGVRHLADAMVSVVGESQGGAIGVEGNLKRRVEPRSASATVCEPADGVARPSEGRHRPRRTLDALEAVVEFVNHDQVPLAIMGAEEHVPGAVVSPRRHRADVLRSPVQ